VENDSNKTPDPDAPKLTEAQRLEDESRVRTIAAGDDLTLAARTLKRARSAPKDRPCKRTASSG